MAKIHDRMAAKNSSARVLVGFLFELGIISHSLAQYSLDHSYGVFKWSHIK